MTLDIIVPLYNNEKNVLNFYTKIKDELKNIKHNIIFVDNSSSDKTLDIIKDIQSKDEENVKIVTLSNNFGKDLSIKAGLEYSKSSLVCIYDLDLQANVTHITKMYTFLLEHEEYDSVCMYSNYEEKNIFKKLRIRIMNKLFNLDIDINRTNYRMMRRNVVNAINKNDYIFSQYIFELIGFNTYYLKFDNKNHLNNMDVKNMLIYSDKPFNFIRIINYIVFIAFIVLLVLRLFNAITIGKSTILFSIIILSMLSIFITRFIVSFNYKKNNKKYFYIKELIGFDDDIL